MTAWFPRPATTSDVELLGSGEELDAVAVFHLLTSDEAVEWRDRVGVAGRTDGSAKPSTRLLLARGLVMKTNLDAASSSPELLRARIETERQRAQAAQIWHPSKQWALVRTSDGWLPVTICRELSTLRTLPSFEARRSGWTAMFSLGLRVAARCGFGLDLNPSNFALEDGVLFYLDDEVYPRLDPRPVGFAIAARIPEEPDIGDSEWLEWGRELQRLFDRRGVPEAVRGEIAEEVQSYPIAIAFQERRTALLDGLRAASTTMRLGRRSFRIEERVGVFGDVHANLPALEAVLAAMRELGVTSYLFLGDAVGYGPHPAECIARLADLPGIAICGNHDHAVATGNFEDGMNRLAQTCAAWTRGSLGAAELEWLAALPADHRDGEWLAVHGAPRDPRRFIAYVYDVTFEDNLAELRREGLSVCFHGHTHVQVAYVEHAAGSSKLAAGKRATLSARQPALINPGSVGQPRDGDPRAAFAVWDRSTATVSFERVAYSVETTQRDLRRACLPSELSTRLERGC